MKEAVEESIIQVVNGHFIFYIQVSHHHHQMPLSLLTMQKIINFGYVYLALKIYCLVLLVMTLSKKIKNLPKMHFYLEKVVVFDIFLI